MTKTKELIKELEQELNYHQTQVRLYEFNINNLKNKPKSQKPLIDEEGQWLYNNPLK